MGFFELTRKRLLGFLVCAVCALGLFFGLFFGLNYPEIVRHGWPLTRCTVLDSRIDQRFCCETSCNQRCVNAPFGAPTCSSITSQINSQFNPQTCAANPSSCPAMSGACDGGYKCCRECCSQCQSCSQSCSSTASGGSSCSTRCSTFRCNCYCCDSVNDRMCTYTCPTCYSAVLDISYNINSGELVNTTYRHDSKKDRNGAARFIDQHRVGMKSRCFYNPRNVGEVTFNVNFTPWKWAISAVFGMVPLFLVMCYGCLAFLRLPFAACRRHFGRGRRPAGDTDSVPAGRRSSIGSSDSSRSEGSSVRRRGSREVHLYKPERKAMAMPMAQPADTDENSAQTS